MDTDIERLRSLASRRFTSDLVTTRTGVFILPPKRKVLSSGSAAIASLGVSIVKVTDTGLVASPVIKRGITPRVGQASLLASRIGYSLPPGSSRNTATSTGRKISPILVKPAIAASLLESRTGVSVGR